MKQLIGLILGSASVWSCVGAEPGGGALPYRFTIAGAKETAPAVPASVELPAGLAKEAVSLWARQGDEWQAVPSQIDPANPRLLWWIATKAGIYEVRAGKQPSPHAVEAKQTEEELRVVIGDEPVLSYRHAPMPPPEGVNARYTRSGFIHPLYSPGGEILTAIHPRDHYHHMGLWSPWTNTTFAGKHVDFWNLNSGEGTVRFVRFESVTSGPVFGGFRAIQEHVALKTPGGETVVLEEVLDVRVWNVGGPAFLVDYTSIQRCVADQPLTLNAYRYGGFGFRGRAGWHTSNSGYLTSEGKTRANGHSSRARWCHAYGETPNGGAGVLFMSHPENREHPEPMRLWPNGANGGQDNMFFNFCPVQKKPWVLEPGKSYTLRYRMCIYDGKPAGTPAEPIWRAFAQPPKVVPNAIP